MASRPWSVGHDGRGEHGGHGGQDRTGQDRTLQPNCGHTLYLSSFLNGQNFWRIKFTPKNANFSR